MVVQQTNFTPEITRRGILQLAAGAVFRSALPPVTAASSIMAVSAEATVAQSLVPLSVLHLHNMSAAIKYSMWDLKGKAEIQKAKSHPEHYTEHLYLFDMSVHAEDRLRGLFTFYVLYDDEQIRSFQKTDRWLGTVAQAKKEMNDSYSYSRPYRKENVILDESFASGQEFTSQTVLKSIVELLDKILTTDDKQRQGLFPIQRVTSYYGETLLDVLLERSSIHAPYFSQPKKMQELTTRQKVEQLLDFSHDRISIPFDVLDLGYRFGWFYLADDQRKSDKTLESELCRMYGDSFSVEKYRQRKDAFVHELDSLFARRSMRKRFEMKTDARGLASISRPDPSAAQALPIQSTVLTRGIDAIKRVFSYAGKHAANDLANAVGEGVKESRGGNQAMQMQEPIALENDPTQSLFDDLVKPEIRMPEPIPVPRTPQP